MALLIVSVVACTVLSIIPISFSMGRFRRSLRFAASCVVLLAALACALVFSLSHQLRRVEDARLRDPVSGSISYAAFLDMAGNLL